MLTGPPALGRIDSTVSDDDTKLEVQKIVDRQRGQVFQLYHFSKVVSRGNSIIREVMERNSRLQRICKIKGLTRQM